jgi:hypothetical protein
MRQRRFVVLEHTWNGTHWDVMFEDGFVLKTWALDTPIVEARDLRARQLADHRLDYLDYEGPVSGERGVVRRWDEGTYELLEWTPEVVRLRLSGTQLSGDVRIWRNETGEVEGSGAGASWSFRLGKVD